MTHTNSRPVSIYVLFILLAFQGLSGLFGGGALVLDPTGQSLQMPLSLLRDSPFSTYFIPGLILFTILGIIPVIVLYGLLKKYRWAWIGSLFVGFALFIWIGVEILMIGYQAQPPLQLIYGSTAILILMVTFIPSVKQYLNR